VAEKTRTPTFAGGRGFSFWPALKCRSRVSLFFAQGQLQRMYALMLDDRLKKLFRCLYAQLTTTQIMNDIREAGLTHDDWMELLRIMMPEQK